MASRSLDILNPEIREKALAVVEDCANQGVEMLIYCTYRSLEEQARLYRQSRYLYEVEKKVKQMRKLFPRLADILWEVGPQAGKAGQHVTMCAPGESWHNWSLAFDAVPLNHGKAVWDAEHPHWKVYALALERQKLHWLGKGKSFKEYPHAQLIRSPGPLEPGHKFSRNKTYAQIEDTLLDMDQKYALA